MYVVSQVQQRNFDFICDSQQFADLFDIALSTDVTALSRALCDMVTAGNATLNGQQIVMSLNIDKLTAKVRTGC